MAGRVFRVGKCTGPQMDAEERGSKHKALTGKIIFWQRARRDKTYTLSPFYTLKVTSPRRKQAQRASRRLREASTAKE